MWWPLEEPTTIMLGILVFLVVENAVEIYITMRQIRVYERSKQVPKELKEHMNEETFHKARLYGLDQEKFSVFKLFAHDIVVTSLEIYTGFIATTWYVSMELCKLVGIDSTNEISVSCVFVVGVSLISFFKDLPLKIYKIFWLEEKHGFNKQTAGFFAWDQVKGLLVGQVLMVPITAALVYIVKNGGDRFFIWLWVFTGVVTLILLTIYPMFIAPLFDKYTPLQEGPLREDIEELAERLSFPLTKLYVVEGSKRSSHSNAYFYGLWNSKRIVLYDTLLLNKGKSANEPDLKPEEQGKGCTDDEVVAVLAHELGHWSHGHMLKNILITQVQLFLMFMVFGYLFAYDPLYEALGFQRGTRPVVVGMLVIFTYVLAPYNALIGFLMTNLSRRFEYQADKFAQQLGYSDLLGRALIKLHIDNLGFPIYDWLYSAWNHSHPTLLQRLARLEELDSGYKKRK